MIKELYNAEIFYRLNWAILWNKDTGQLYWRNTWTGKEINLGLAQKEKEAKELMVKKAGRINSIKNKLV